jgi:hydrogenase maturation protein HypF
MTALATSEVVVRHRVRVVGVVQGVGFRPFVHRLAVGLDLSGHVGNDTEGVLIEVEGPASCVEGFEALLVDEAPPLARIHRLEATPVEPRMECGFRIAPSRADGAVRTFVSPDVAVCQECLNEFFDTADRRHRYPFINCTNCGPRFTITMTLPYDRRNTTMRDFDLCAECDAEYTDPSSRRFHAQPIACAACGPHVWFEGHEVAVGTDASVGAAQLALARGEIVALKGLGGYHLACDATSDEAVGELRRRKGRPDKPLAVMAGDLATAETFAVLDPKEVELLCGPVHPIVLLRRRQVDVLSALVAPSDPLVGILLPYTPLHHLLFGPVPGLGGPVPRILVMTSGNVSDEPICYEDADARARLGHIADGWLVHDRPIHVPCDDSVVRLEDGEQLPIRRSRGYAPMPVPLPFDSAPVLATGGELKNTFCVASGHNAWMSQHIGDMASPDTVRAFERSTGQFAGIYRVEPERVATDSHPGYQTHRWAKHSAWSQVDLVQHHHAHIAAVMVEHGVPVGERVVGYAFDGTGYGTDGAIWGGEVLVCDYDRWERFSHLRYVSMPGGDATIRKPYRAALAHLRAAGIAWDPDLPPVAGTSSSELTVIERQLERNVHCVLTSSMGRLFDAVSSLLGVRHVVSYEAQAALELERCATEFGGVARPYEFLVGDDGIDPGPVLRAIVDDLREGQPVGGIASGFHLAVATLIADTADALRRRTGIRRVALSGGVFQNVVLVRLARTELARRNLEVLTHHVVPPNDGGLALGQAAIAGHRRSCRSEA